MFLIHLLFQDHLSTRVIKRDSLCSARLFGGAGARLFMIIGGLDLVSSAGRCSPDVPILPLILLSVLRAIAFIIVLRLQKII